MTIISNNPVFWPSWAIIKHFDTQQ